jgi:hypothetical protein
MLDKINPSTGMSWGVFYASFDTAAARSHGGGRIYAENILDIWNIGWIMLNQMIQFIKC